MEYKKRIIVEHGVSSKLAKVFNVTNAMVTKALHGRGGSELAIKIRYVAISQYGGKEIDLSVNTNQ